MKKGYHPLKDLHFATSYFRNSVPIDDMNESYQEKTFVAAYNSKITQIASGQWREEWKCLS
jgi:hypothetical protein